MKVGSVKGRGKQSPSPTHEGGVFGVQRSPKGREQARKCPTSGTASKDDRAQGECCDLGKGRREGKGGSDGRNLRAPRAWWGGEGSGKRAGPLEQGKGGKKDHRVKKKELLGHEDASFTGRTGRRLQKAWNRF